MLLSGCSAVFRESVTGPLSRQSVVGKTETASTTSVTQLLWLYFRPETNEVSGTYSRSLRDAVDAADDITVDERTHERLLSEFTAVGYLLQVCPTKTETDSESGGCPYAYVSREEFNDAQFSAEISAFLSEDGTELDITDTVDGAYDPRFDSVTVTD